MGWPSGCARKGLQQTPFARAEPGGMRDAGEHADCEPSGQPSGGEELACGDSSAAAACAGSAGGADRAWRVAGDLHAGRLRAGKIEVTP